MKANTIFRNTTDGFCYRTVTPLNMYRMDGFCKRVKPNNFRANMGASLIPVNQINLRSWVQDGTVEILTKKAIRPVSRKSVRTIVIDYEIMSYKCLKSVVKGTKIFIEDSKSISFIKRLQRVKNALSVRYYTLEAAGNDCIQAIKKNKPILLGNGAWGDRSVMPYKLSYSCKTIR